MIRPGTTLFTTLFSTRFRAACLLAAAVLPLAAHAQALDDEPPTVSRPMVEPTAPSAGKALNTALERLARDPRNVEALLGAGNAALALGDNDAALGFFGRADQVDPANPTVKAAIAGARLHLDDPVEALRWYADAERLGANATSFALDRGLAYDLVGDNLAAIAQYREVIARAFDPALRDEATRRMAISLAIGGDRRSADLALLPLLQRQDRAAWRAHIFVLAIAGRADEADKVARATMPANLAEPILPYLNFMARLTPAQQAAVASQGRFPRAAEIGRDDPRVAAYAAVHPRVPLAPAAKPVAAQPVAVASAADEKRRRRHGTTPSMTMLAGTAPVASAPAAAEPDLVLPPPPPPVAAGSQMVMATAVPHAPPPVPDVSRTKTTGPALAQAEPDNAAVPRPTVLSRLDMPPPSRRTLPPRTELAAPPPATTTVAPPPAQYQSAPPPLTGTAPTVATLPPPPPPATNAGIAMVEVPASHPMVEPAPRPAPVHIAEAHPAPEKTRVAAKAKLKADADDEPVPTKSAKGSKDKEDAKADAKKGKGKNARSAKDDDDVPASKDKAGRKKTSRDDDDDATLGPCKPTPKKGHAKQAPIHSKTRRGAKGRKQVEEDTDTCVKAHGARPDGPGDVSRDTDDTPVAKTKGKKGARDKDAEREVEKPAKGKARYTSRIWVQVLTGGDRDKMAGEWRGMVAKSRALKGHKPWLSPWRSNFRLLTGPFDSDADAQDFIAKLRKDGVSSYEWTSPAGQAVDSLPL